MLYSQTSDRLAIVVDKGFFEEPIEAVVDSLHSHIKTLQITTSTDNSKEEVSVDDLIQEMKVIQLTGSMINQDDLLEVWPKEPISYDDTYYFDMIKFEAQDTEFLVPKHRFLDQTDSFSFFFEAGHGSPENPMLLPGVSARDFRCLLKYLYPSVGPSAIWSQSDWISVLSLSTKWKMLDIRADMIRKLGRGLKPIKKVELGSKHKIADWVLSGLVSLVERPEHFKMREVYLIGLDQAVKLSQLREQEHSDHWDTYLNEFTLEAHGTSNLMSKCFPDGARTGESNDDFVSAILEADSLPNRKFLQDACGRITRRVESLTLEEVDRLGLQITIKIWEARIETRKAAESLLKKMGKLGPRSATPSVSERVSAMFEEELSGVKVEESRYKLSK